MEPIRHDPVWPDPPIGETAPAAVWLISETREVIDRVARIVERSRLPLELRRTGAMDNPNAWAACPHPSPLVVLDVDRDLERGCRLIGRLRERRPEAPLVVLGTELTRDFAEKIVSQGVNFFFSHDFAESEFESVLMSLWSRRRNP